MILIIYSYANFILIFVSVVFRICLHRAKNIVAKCI